jgi:hypothetical protein
MELHRVQKKVVTALEPLSPEDRRKVIAAVLAIYGEKEPEAGR